MMIYKLQLILFILQVQQNGNYPLISIYKGKLVNIFYLTERILKIAVFH